MKRKDEIKEINKLFWRANFDKKDLTGNPLDLNRI